MELYPDSPEKVEGVPLWRLLVKKDWELRQSMEPQSITRRREKSLKENLIDSGPALIAMKGLPSPHRRNSVASRIASFHRCANLDYDDFRTSTQEAHQDLLLLSADPEVAASARHHLDNLSHRALLQFASTQLLLGHDVVVDSLLSRPTAMGELLDVADSNGVPLIVIERMVLDMTSWRRRLRRSRDSWSGLSSSALSKNLDFGLLLKGRLHSFDYDNSDVPRLVIDTKQFRLNAVHDLDEIILKFILLYKLNVESDCEGTASLSNESGRDEQKRKRHFTHSHPLAFLPKRDNNTPAAAAPDCRICSLPIRQSSYNCRPCDFRAHKVCIELPQYKKFSFHIHPLGLFVPSNCSTELFEESVECVVCRIPSRPGPMYRCWQCYGLFVHYKCAAGLSHKLEHPCHEHPLKLKTYNLFSSRNQYTCRACGHKGGDISYGCSACKLKLHVSCALGLPLEIKYKCAQGHPLVLAPNPKDNKYDEYFCDVCEEPRHVDYWIYYCGSCEFHAHLNCVIPRQISAYNMAETENSNSDASHEEEEKEEQKEDYDDEEDYVMMLTTNMIMLTTMTFILMMMTAMIVRRSKINRPGRWAPLGSESAIITRKKKITLERIFETTKCIYIYNATTGM